jgi:HNH endonuclease
MDRRQNARSRGKPPNKATPPARRGDATNTEDGLEDQLDSPKGSGPVAKVVKGDAADRFWQKVRKTSTCWLWTAGCCDGYGRFWFQGRDWRAHRWLYNELVAPVVDGMDVEHLCHVRNCVRPAHLDLVEPWENQRRGFSPFAINARRTRCASGHDLTDPTNVYIRPDGRGTQCRECIRIRRAAHKAKLRQARRAA